jgi:carboxylesterase type B
MHDQVLALKWVRGHISAFGGDKANVTIMGESAKQCLASHTLSHHYPGVYFTRFASTNLI